MNPIKIIKNQIKTANLISQKNPHKIYQEQILQVSMMSLHKLIKKNIKTTY